MLSTLKARSFAHVWIEEEEEEEEEEEINAHFSIDFVFGVVQWIDINKCTKIYVYKYQR